MLTGWYCRSIANMQQQNDADNDDDRDGAGGDSDDDSRDDQVPIDYKTQYHNLKRKLKFLLYENESFQSALQSCQRRHLKVTRDRSFLLDRLLQYEKVDHSSSDSDDTESSEEEINRSEVIKRKRDSSQNNNHGPVNTMHNSSVGKSHQHTKKRRPPAPKIMKTSTVQQSFPSRIENIITGAAPVSGMSDGHMTPEEVERHLQSRQSYMELLPERAPPTVPTEMFSNDPSLDSESNDLLETSPSNIGEECLSIDMNMMVD